MQRSETLLPRRGAALALLACLPSLPAGLAAQHGWVAETNHFRVLGRPALGEDGTAVATAAADLESVRRGFQQAGLGAPPGTDGRLEVLVVPDTADLHALLGDPPSSRTRGVTIRGLDRSYTVVPWRGLIASRITLAHEYAHYIDRDGWPPWFREGRAVYLARRAQTRDGGDPQAGVAAILDGAEWMDWPEILSAARHSAATEEPTFQAQSWLLFHWLASLESRLARVAPEDAAAALSRMGGAALDEALRRHRAQLSGRRPDWLVPLPASPPETVLRTAAEWEVPLYEAEARLALGMLATAERSLADLARRFPREPRVLAAEGLLQVALGRQDLAEERLRQALRLGDSRARTAYRYAVLLMGPGPVPDGRAEAALRFATRARDRMPQLPAHHLAVAHARMLREDWPGAYRALRELLRHPDWVAVAEREAAETRRRRMQALQSVPRPALDPSVPAAVLPAAEPPPLAAWTDPPEGESGSGRRIWPPHDTWLVHGRIAWVRCADGAKTVVLHSPYQRLVLRENPDRPPRLINRPFRDRSLPCDSRGWIVAIAYRKLAEGGEVRGEIVGIRF